MKSLLFILTFSFLSFIQKSTCSDQFDIDSVYSVRTGSSKWSHKLLFDEENFIKFVNSEYFRVIFKSDVYTPLLSPSSIKMERGGQDFSPKFENVELSKITVTMSNGEKVEKPCLEIKHGSARAGRTEIGNLISTLKASKIYNRENDNTRRYTNGFIIKEGDHYVRITRNNANGDYILWPGKKIYKDKKSNQDIIKFGTYGSYEDYSDSLRNADITDLTEAGNFQNFSTLVERFRSNVAGILTIISLNELGKSIAAPKGGTESMRLIKSLRDGKISPENFFIEHKELARKLYDQCRRYIKIDSSRLKERIEEDRVTQQDINASEKSINFEEDHLNRSASSITLSDEEDFGRIFSSPSNNLNSLNFEREGFNKNNIESSDENRSYSNVNFSRAIVLDNSNLGKRSIVHRNFEGDDFDEFSNVNYYQRLNISYATEQKPTNNISRNNYENRPYKSFSNVRYATQQELTNNISRNNYENRPYKSFSNVRYATQQELTNNISRNNYENRPYKSFSNVRYATQQELTNNASRNNYENRPYKSFSNVRYATQQDLANLQLHTWKPIELPLSLTQNISYATDRKGY